MCPPPRDNDDNDDNDDNGVSLRGGHIGCRPAERLM
jgi:hypothetical protein